MSCCKGKCGKYGCKRCNIVRSAKELLVWWQSHCWCTQCETHLNWSGVWCPCCGQRVRHRPTYRPTKHLWNRATAMLRAGMIEI